MNLQAIYHRPKSNFCYAYNQEEIHIRLRTAKGDIDRVTLVWGDKYRWDQARSTQMKKRATSTHFDYYNAIIIPKNKRLAYYFIVEKGEEKIIYTEVGYFERVSNDEIHHHLFQYPYLNGADIHVVPEWVKETVFYQIFPERFCNGKSGISPDNIQPWGDKPSSKSFFGGDIHGIIQKLDYIKELGVNGIYLTPIFQSPTNHKYDTTDYFKIDPHFGDMDTLKQLVEQCHSRGIRIILDAVFNHSGYYFEPFQDVIKNGENSRYKDWFIIDSLPITTDPLSYHAFAFVASMPKLNTQNPEVQDYLLNVARHYVEEIGIDGWRLDVADEVDHSFWRRFREVVKSANPDAYIVGEIWHDSLPWLMGDQFDAIMNYPVTRAVIDFIAYNKIEGHQFVSDIIDTQFRNTQQVNQVMFNLLDSHDTPRFLTRCNNDTQRLMLAVVFQMTFLGTPCVYYGSEVGMTGEHDPDCRKTMIWVPEYWNQEIYNFYRRIIDIRRNNIALNRGDCQFVYGDKDVVIFSRNHQEQQVIVMLNNGNEAKEIELGGEQYKDLYNNDKGRVQINRVIVQPKDFLILCKQD